MKSETSIEVFNEIRDIPYSIPLQKGEINNSCSGKVIILKDKLKKLEIKSRFRVVSFKWSEVNIPKKILNKLKTDFSTHVYLEVNIGNTWYNVDPTWDKGLITILPVNKWDGKSHTSIAVPVIGMYSKEESQSIMSEVELKLESKRKSENDEFYKALNIYLQEVRSSEF